MEKRNTTWYIQRRGELLAEQFLLDLHPDSIMAVSLPGSPFDFLATFTKPDRTPVIIGVEVKATQQEISGRYPFPAEQATRLLRSNIPVLVIVVDVKANEVYYNWIKDAIPPEKQGVLSEVRTCNLHLRQSSDEEVKKLRTEIMADHMLTVS